MSKIEKDFVKSSEKKATVIVIEKQHNSNSNRKAVIVDSTRHMFSEQSAGKSYSYCTRWGIAGSCWCSLVSERSLLGKCAEKKISRKPKALLKETVLIICDDMKPLETPIVRLVCEKFNR